MSQPPPTSEVGEALSPLCIVRQFVPAVHLTQEGVCFPDGIWGGRVRG